MTDIFRPHGNFHSRIEGRFVITEVDGPWNKELVEAWARHIYPYVKELNASGPHVGIGIIRGSMLCPPDAMDVLALAVRYGVEKLGSVGEVIVVDATVEGHGLVEPAYERVYEGLVPFRFVESMEEALKWAHERIQATLPATSSGK